MLVSAEFPSENLMLTTWHRNVLVLKCLHNFLSPAMLVKKYIFKGRAPDDGIDKYIYCNVFMNIKMMQANPITCNLWISSMETLETAENVTGSPVSITQFSDGRFFRISDRDHNGPMSWDTNVPFAKSMCHALKCMCHIKYDFSIATSEHTCTGGKHVHATIGLRFFPCQTFVPTSKPFISDISIFCRPNR
jgi:hypothetical protein